jgi:hypothetical protein
MKVGYRKRFLKDLASVPANLRGSIERFVFEELPRADSLQSTGKIEKHGQTISAEDMWVNIGLNKREIGKAACINKYSENCNF